MSTENTPLVVIYPRGQLTPDDKATMREAGIIAVEADDPKAVQQLHLTQPMVNTRINGDGIVRAALKAIAEREPADGYGNIKDAGRIAHSFVRLVSESLEARDEQH